MGKHSQVAVFRFQDKEFGFFPLPIWELELGTYWVFAGLESEPFSLLNTCLRVRGSYGLIGSVRRSIEE